MRKRVRLRSFLLSIGLVAVGLAFWRDAPLRRERHRNGINERAAIRRAVRHDREAAFCSERHREDVKRYEADVAMAIDKSRPQQPFAAFSTYKPNEREFETVHNFDMPACETWSDEVAYHVESARKARDEAAKWRRWKDETRRKMIFPF